MQEQIRFILSLMDDLLDIPQSGCYAAIDTIPRNVEVLELIETRQVSVNCISEAIVLDKEFLDMTRIDKEFGSIVINIIRR